MNNNVIGWRSALQANIFRFHLCLQPAKLYSFVSFVHALQIFFIFTVNSFTTQLNTDKKLNKLF